MRKITEPGGAGSSVDGPGIEAEARALRNEQPTGETAEPQFWPGGFLKLPRILLDGGYLARLKPTELALLLVILQRVNFCPGKPVEIRSTEVCGPAGISRRSFGHAIAKLSEGSLITAKLTGKGYEVRLQSPNHWQLSSWKAKGQRNEHLRLLVDSFRGKTSGKSE
jgi:hypothetical protein